MHIRFPEKDEEFIKNAVAQGYYANETEVVRDAVRKLRETEQKRSYVYNLLLKADEEIARGGGRPLTKELLHQIMNEGIEAARLGKPYHSKDAVPDDAFDPPPAGA